jgi:tight adherence protein C
VDPARRAIGGLTVPVVLGLAWGALLAAPLVVRGRRAVPAARAASLGGDGVDTRRRVLSRVPRLHDAVPAPVVHVLVPVARVTRSLAGRRRRRAQAAALRRDLPVAIDLLGVAVAAGCTPYLAVEVVARWGPPAIVTRFDTVLRRCRLGSSLEDSLVHMARDTAELEPLVDALLATDRLGAPIGPVLARLAEEERVALRRRAEAHARRVPVRLLFPLVFLVLPAFVLLTVVPGLAAGLSRL